MNINNNYYNPYNLQYILEVIKRDNNETVDFNDFKSELFDMVQPKDPSRITFQDILNRFAIGLWIWALGITLLGFHFKIYLIALGFAFTYFYILLPRYSK